MRPMPPEAARMLDRFSDEVHEIMLRLRGRVLASAPDVHETISDVGYTVSLQYSPDDKVGHAFCYIAGFSKHANLGFQHGASLPDPENALAGTGAFMRHLKFFKVEQTQAPWLDAYLQAALTRSTLDVGPDGGRIAAGARTQGGRRRSSGVRKAGGAPGARPMKESRPEA